MKATEKVMKPGRCPLWSSNQELADLNDDLKRLTRRLRRDLGRCQACPKNSQASLKNSQASPKYFPPGSGGECAAMGVLRRQVQAAVQLVNVELALFQDDGIG